MKKFLACVGAVVCLCLGFTACNAGGTTSSSDFSTGIENVNKTGTFYEVSINFYVNPQKGESAGGESEYGLYSYKENVMDSMVKLLSSEAFAEQLILDGEGLSPDTTKLKAYCDAVTYSYKLNTNGSGGFFDASISVQDDQAFAGEVMNRVKDYVPVFIEEHMPKPDGYVSTSCVVISRNNQIQKVVYKNGKKVK